MQKCPSKEEEKAITCTRGFRDEVSPLPIHEEIATYSYVFVCVCVCSHMQEGEGEVKGASYTPEEEEALKHQFDHLFREKESSSDGGRKRVSFHPRVD